MPKKGKNIDEHIEKISRKSNLNIRNSEYAFDKQLEKLDKDIDKIVKEKVKDFDNNKFLTEQYLTIDYTESTINRYREKLKKI